MKTDATLSQQLAAAVREEGLPEDLMAILRELSVAAKRISAAVNRGGLSTELHGLTGERNVHGEEVQKLDAYANDLLVATLNQCDHVALMASEESEGPLAAGNGGARGRYIVAFDPLDGSSNIDTNASIGTIFSIHKVRDEPPAREHLLHQGAEQVAAGYAIYGSATLFVYTARRGVHGFTLDPAPGEFLLSHPDIRCPPQGKTYSINEGNASFWSEAQSGLVAWYKQPDEATQRPYKARYIGSLVADFHRTLIKGGIFMYPGDSKSPHGKLRYLYEAAPLAMVCEEAGGAASDGRQRMLDIVPTELHQRVPLYIGSEELVENAVELLAGSS